MLTQRARDCKHLQPALRQQDDDPLTGANACFAKPAADGLNMTQ